MRRIVTALLLLAGLALPAAAQTRTSACSAISLGDLGALNGWVPSPNDAWHQDISALPVDANSDKIITTPGDLANRYLHPDFSNVIDGAYGIPYTIIDSTHVPFVPITPYDSGDSDNTLYPITASTPIEGSPGQCWTDGNYDHHAIVIDRTTCVSYEIYQADLCNGQWTSYGNVIWDFTLPAGEKRPYGVSSVDAAGLSVFEGLIRYDEIVAGQINHAIRFTAVHTKQDNANGYFTAPATHAAGNLWGTDDIMGMRIRLKASFDVSSYSQTNQIILNAMKKYGMILADNGGDMFFQGTPDPRWNDTDLSNLKQIPSTAFEVVKMNPIYDAYTAPTGPAPTIQSFTASANNVAAGTPVTLTPLVGGGSYEFIDAAGFTRGPVTVTPNCTTTYTLYSRNEFDTAQSSVTVNVTGSNPANCVPNNPPGGTTPNLVFPNVGPQNYPAIPFTVAATSDSPGAISYIVVTGPATIAGNTVTLTGAGNVTLEADQAASGSYTAASIQMTFAVGAGSAPVLQFDHIADQVLGAAPFTVHASSNSPGAITYSVISGPATLSGNVLTMTAAGRIVLMASQAASGNYTAATATIAFNVINGGTLPGLTFNPVPNQTVGAAPFVVSATSNSAAPITYSVANGPATLSGTIVTVTGVGTVTLQASQPQWGTYAAQTVTTSFTVSGITPTLTFNPIANQTYGASPFTVAATSNSTGAISYAVVSGPATISGNTVTLTGTGTVTLQASQAPAAGYNAATARTSFNVSGNAPALSFNVVPNQAFGAAPFAVSATSNSPGAITYSVLSGPATISGNTVTLTGAGSVTLQATQAAASGYTSGSTSTSFIVVATTPTLSINAIGNQTFGAAPFTVSATSNSTGVITFSIASGPATIAGNVVTLTGSGSVVLHASQAAASGYGTASANTSFNVSGVTPTLSFAPIASQTLGAAPFAVSATSNSTGTITYTVINGPATIAGNVVTITGVGSVMLQASQAAAGGFTAASANTSFTVTGAGPSLVFNQVANKTFGDAPFTVSATSNSPGAITYAVLGGPATIAGSVVTLTGAGTVTLQASQAASGSFVAAAVTSSFSVASAGSNLVFNPVANQAVGASPFNVFATSNSAGAITYSVISGPASITGNTVTVTGVGLVTIQAVQAANAGYGAATAATSFSVNPGIPNLTIPTIPAQTFGGAPIALSANSNSPAPAVWSVVSGPAVILGNSVSFTAAGPVTLQVAQAASGNFASATATATFNVNPALPNLAIASIPTQTFGAGPLTVSATSNSNMPITFTVVSGPATIAGTTVTLTGTGAVVLQATQAASSNYLAGTATTSFTIAPSSVVLAGDFAMPNNITITMNQGDNKDVSIPVSAINGFNGLVSFKCAVPAAMTYGACNTTTAQLTATSATTATVTVSTKGYTMTAEDRGSPLRPTTTGLVLLGCLLPCGLPFLNRRKINLRRLGMGLLLVLSLGAVSMSTTGCGSMILNALTPAGTYVLNVNATSGSASHAMTVTVIVQQPKN